VRIPFEAFLKGLITRWPADLALQGMSIVLFIWSQPESGANLRRPPQLCATRLDVRLGILFIRLNSCPSRIGRQTSGAARQLCGGRTRLEPGWDFIHTD